MLLTLVLSCVALLLCLLHGMLHTWLIAKGRTQYEWQQLRARKRRHGRSLFDYGVVNNFALTLGVYPMLWLMPTREGIEGNGIFFPEQACCAAAIHPPACTSHVRGHVRVVLTRDASHMHRNGITCTSHTCISYMHLIHAQERNH